MDRTTRVYEPFPGPYVFLAREEVVDFSEGNTSFGSCVIGIYGTMDKAMQACEKRSDLYFTDAKGVIQPGFVFSPWDTDTIGNKTRRNPKGYFQTVTREKVQ